MRVMVCVKASKESEAGVLPDTKLFEAMTAFNEKLVKAGVMLAGDGLKPTSEAKRLKFDGGKVTVTDGPFAETKEIVAGFWIWKVASMDEAIEWLKQSPFDGGAEVDIRPFYETDDLGENLTPELRAREAKLRAKSEKLGKS